MGSYQYIAVLTDNVGGTISIGWVSMIEKKGGETGDVIHEGSFRYSIRSVVIK
jgi:hypothetical protein